MASIRHDLLLGITICKCLLTKQIPHPKAHTSKGAIGYCTARIVHEQLIALGEATKVTQEPKKPQTQPNEDCAPRTPSKLRKLLISVSPEA